MLTPDPGARGFLITTTMGVSGVGDVVSRRWWFMNTEGEAALAGLEWMRYPAVLSCDSCLVAASRAPTSTFPIRGNQSRLDSASKVTGALPIRLSETVTILSGWR